MVNVYVESVIVDEGGSSYRLATSSSMSLSLSVEYVARRFTFCGAGS